MEKKYEINEGTLAIFSIDKKSSKVLEDNKSYQVEMNSFEILDHSCKYFGSSYEGRKAGAKAIIGANYKLPIVVEDMRNIIFFPTSSPYENDCVWLAVNKIVKFYPESFNSTLIVFDNGVEVSLPFSYRTLQNQIFRASRLSYLLNCRKNFNENK